MLPMLLRRRGPFLAVAGAGAIVAALGFSAGRNGGKKVDPAISKQVVREEALPSPERDSASRRAAELVRASGDVGVLRVVLREWAAENPAAAAEWADRLPDDQRSLALEAVFKGTAQRPEEAVRAARELSEKRPQRSGDYGYWLIAGLTEGGAFAEAARFAIDDNSSHRAAWLRPIFSRWAAQQPDEALRAVERIGDAAARRISLEGAFSGWASVDPAALAWHAMTLAPGEERTMALDNALPQWMRREPMAAAEWLGRFDATNELDSGIEAAALNPELVQGRPLVALAWAASIADPTLRANTLRLLVEDWAPRDPEGVREFIVSTPGLPLTDRSALLEALNSPPDA